MYVFLRVFFLYWTQNICEPEIRHSKRGREDGKGKGGARRLMIYRLSSLPYFVWLVNNVCICNGQRSSEISCVKYQYLFASLYNYVASIESPRGQFLLKIVV
jgi:hypothetical protein